MDALSAMKMVAPGLKTGALNPAEADAAMLIPLAELNTLNPGLEAANGAKSPGSFQSLLTNMVGDVVEKQAAANDAMVGLMSGKNVSLHQAMISMEEANVSFQLMVEVRNKLLESYQELMRMQV
jgi:flagellar hook-basal body complex protein FliE